MKKSLPNPKKIALLFLVLGCVWIVISGELLSLFALPSEHPFWETFKGIFFVLVASGFLYIILVIYKKKLLETLQYGRERENQFMKFFEESPQPTWISSDSKKILFINNAALNLFGYSPSILNGRMPFELINLEETINQSKGPEDRKESNIMRDFYTRTGEHLYLHLIVHDFVYKGSAARLVIANNVTNLIKAEKERERINNELFHYKKALDKTALLSVTDLNGVILDINTRFCEITKYSYEELVGKKTEILRSGHHPASYFQTMYKTVREGNVWRGEMCCRAKDGKLFWVDLSMVPVTDQYNATERYMAISYPITDRKLAELKSEKVQQELMTFMYKASHNLRGPVATLSGLLNIARIEMKEQNSVSYINMLNERTKHLEYTLGELIDITKIKQEDLTITLISFQRLIKKVLARFKRELEKFHFEVYTDFQIPVNWQFRNDPKLLFNLFFYLLDNSIKFRSKRESPSICICIREQVGGALISVTDNGPGIDEEIRDRIYEMYYRGNASSTGSGLGLYIVNSIVDRLQGYISLQSKAGEGSTFMIFIPDSRQSDSIRKQESTTYLSDKSIN